ncbi:BEN domain-containing protein 6 [Holothuria leucospilota]|uniref:BEN domain-containing protein 6 n=1 Tax=Holothuria leucospilota TaxID=206669 RepID=A0A9Q0YAD5_HOLLE|nr:BEN domain-containing protein 6 [Holothuria leucospilota]
MVRKCNTHEPSGLVNDILTGLYTNEYLAAHSLTGTSAIDDSEFQLKERLDPTVVKEIVGTVMKHFPQKTPTDVKCFIRQKLNNASKAIKRKNQ